MPLGLHLPELLIILAVALLIFGPKKLPEIGASIGRSISSFKKGMKEVEEGKAKEELQEQAQLEQKRLELEALEHEIASKKVTAAAQVEHAEASTTDSKLG
jgi:sec-independent protein translocase protein TatA